MEDIDSINILDRVYNFVDPKTVNMEAKNMAAAKKNAANNQDNNVAPAKSSILK